MNTTNNLLSKKPLLTLCGAFTLSTFLFYFINGKSKLLLLCLSLFIVLSLGIFRLLCPLRAKQYALFPWVLFSFGIAFGGLISYQHYNIKVPNITSYAGTSAEISALVKEVDLKTDYASTYTVRITSVDGQKSDFNAKLSFSREYDAERDDKLSLRVTFSLPEENANGFPLRSYYASQGIYLIAEAEESEVTSAETKGTLLSFFAGLTDKLSSHLKLRLGQENGSLAAALLLGRQDELSDATTRDFRFLGISHILSVSGLHLSILVGGLLYILRFGKFHRVIQLIAGSLLILLVMLLTGFPASIIRSGIMLFLVLLGNSLGRIEDPLISLSLASSLILAVSPASVTDAGFLLSFSATLGLITLGNKLSSRIMKRTGGKKLLIRTLGKMLSSVCATVSAVIFTLPFLWIYFGELSLVSPLTNLLFVPLSAVFLFLSAGVLLFGSTPIAPVFIGTAGSVGTLISDLAEALAKTVPEPVSLRYDFTVFAFLFALLSVVLLVFIKKKSAFHLLIPAVVWGIVFSSCLAVYQYNNAETAVILTVNLKKNDFILIKSEGKTLLCDFSDGTFTQANRAAGLAQSELYDASIDALLLTHLHNRHTVTFRRLADNNRLEYLILPEPYDEQTEVIAEELTAAAEERGIQTLLYPSDKSASLSFSACTLTLPGITFLDRSVQTVNALRIGFGAGHFTYLGAAAFESEKSDLFSEYAESADLLWLGIHGPLIKQALPPLTLPHTAVLVSSDAVNEAYGTYFDTVASEETVCRKIVFRKK